MRILLIILGIVAALVVVVLIIALFIKSDYSIERQISINQPSQKVFNYIKYVKNQDVYSVWNRIDPSMQKTYSGTDGTVGFMYGWDSRNKKAGKGEQQITAIKEGERIDMDIHFIKPFEGKAHTYMSATPQSANQTNVKWVLNSKMNYPMNFMLLFMNMEKMIGNDLEGGLSNLKQTLENNKF